MSLQELTALQHECANKAQYYRIAGNPTLAERFEIANRHACNALTFIQVALEYEVVENGHSRFEEWLSHGNEKL